MGLHVGTIDCDIFSSSEDWRSGVKRKGRGRETFIVGGTFACGERVSGDCHLSMKTWSPLQGQS